MRDEDAITKISSLLFFARRKTQRQKSFLFSIFGLEKKNQTFISEYYKVSGARVIYE